MNRLCRLSSRLGRAGLWLGILTALLVVGCSRQRAFRRTARRSIALPPTQQQPLEQTIAPEIPLTLEPNARRHAAYGLSQEGMPCPSGPSGFSSDMRYPQSGNSRRAAPPRPATVSPPNSVQHDSARSTGPTTAPRDITGQEPPLPPERMPKSNGRAPAARTPDSTTVGPAQLPAQESQLAPGIPRYTVVTRDVAAGGQPTLEGLRWLKERGYRAVLNLLPETDADPAEASMVQELGLEYRSLPVAPETITRQTVAQFNQIVDSAERPLFIHDSTGTRTGAMWYIRRITIDRVPPETARREATQIGLSTSDTELWLAIQRFLAESR